MTDGSDDDLLLRRQQAFLQQIERVIRAANREIIHKHLPEISGDDVTRLAVVVAELRARYLEEAAKKMAERDQGVPPDSAEIARLAKAREHFDEVAHAFDALKRAIERGYVDLKITEVGEAGRG
jgi:hypothetical protein